MQLRISTAPHIRSHDTTARLMLDVVIALIPTAVAGVYLFGLYAALVILLAMASAVLSEYLFQRITKRPVRIMDGSALVTGFILALNLPPTAPWWLPVIGSALAIVLIKQLFGGIGDNFMNPALAARGILLASWPVRMTNYIAPNYFKPEAFSLVDAVTSATPLAGSPADVPMLDLLLGNIPGTIGEVSKVAILLGLAYMLIRKTISWRIPVLMLASAGLFSFLFEGVDPVSTILSGGLMFGAVFMATDYTTSPMTAKGQMIYAVGCGLIVSVIRAFGAYPEGVTYAILLMNILTPLIDKYVSNRVYGYVKPAKPAKKAKKEGVADA